MIKRTISILKEQDEWYHSQMISLSKFVQNALQSAMDQDKAFKKELKEEFPSLVKQNKN